MKIYTEKLRIFLSDIKLDQIVSLMSVNILGIPLGIISSILVARFLGVNDYGNYMFIVNVISLAITFCTFGLYHAANRAITICDDKKKIREYYGAMLLISFALFTIIYILLLNYALFDYNVNAKGITDVFIYILPFCWVFIFVQFFEVLLQASNEIKILSKTRLYPKLIYCISVLYIYFIVKEYHHDKVIFITYLWLFSQFIVFLFMFFKLKVSFEKMKLRIKEIFTYNNSYGIYVYMGTIFAVGFSQLSTILISYFGDDNSGVAYYTLALTIASPLLFIPTTVATTHFKEFSKIDSINNKILLITFSLSIISLLISWILIEPFVKIFYGTEFNQVINLFYIVSAGVVLYGLADFYNRFLGANGRGKMLRNCSFIVGFCLLIFNITLIPNFGDTGAALTKLFTGLVYFISIRYYYNKFKSLKNK